MASAASMKTVRGYDAERGREDVESLGGFTVKEARQLEQQASDEIRRRMVTSWFGHHGGKYAWDLFVEWRRRRRVRQERTG
jgi:hypothetical protein